jgi:hypothetical protein
MSKHMQLTVTGRPYYETGLEATYPKLARHLGYLAPDLVKGNPALCELVGQFDHLLYCFEGTTLREVLLRHRESLLTNHRGIQENIADWNIAQDDRLLYGIEDAFDEIESELD